MHIDRRRFIAGAGGVMLAGCGGSGGSEPQPGPPLGVVPGPAPPPTPVPSPTPSPLQAVRLDDPRLTLSGFAAVERSATRIRATRAADHQGLGFVTPGGRLAFSTDATGVRVDLAFHRTMGGANVLDVGRGGDPTDAILLVDGAPFRSVRSGSLPGDPARADLSIIGLPPGVKRVDVIWSHVRQMDVVGLALDTGSLSPVVKPARRLVCGGDSITQGHSLGDPVYTWPFMLGPVFGLEPVNMGYSGRTAVLGDGARDGALGGAIGTYLIGHNDWAERRPLAEFGDAVTAYMTDWFDANPTTDPALVMIAPIPSTRQVGSAHALQAYREEMEVRVKAFAQANAAKRVRFVDGRDVIMRLDGLADGIHPNEAGAADLFFHLQPVIRALL